MTRAIVARVETSRCNISPPLGACEPTSTRTTEEDPLACETVFDQRRVGARCTARCADDDDQIPVARQRQLLHTAGNDSGQTLKVSRQGAAMRRHADYSADHDVARPREGSAQHLERVERPCVGTDDKTNRLPLDDALSPRLIERDKATEARSGRASDPATSLSRAGGLARDEAGANPTGGITSPQPRRASAQTTSGAPSMALPRHQLQHVRCRFEIGRSCAVDDAPRDRGNKITAEKWPVRRTRAWHLTATPRGDPRGGALLERQGIAARMFTPGRLRNLTDASP